LTVSWNSGNWSQLGFAQVIFNEVQTSSNDYILYYGDNPYYQAIGASSALPVVYDVCDSWDSEHPFSLELRKSPYTSSDWISLDSYTLSSCSGTLLLNDISATIELSETAKLVIYNGETTIVGSNEFLYVAYTPLSVDNNSFIHYYYPNGLYVDTSGGNGTTTINFAYDVCSDDNFSSSTFYLKNLDSGNTNISFTPTQCNAAASLELPYTQNLQLFFPATISYQRNGVEYLTSSSFRVVFYSNNVKPIWGDSDVSTSTSWFVNFSTSWLSKFLVVFPFNIPILMKSAWDKSAYSSLNSDLDFLLVAESDGSVVGSFPKEWALTSNDVPITLFSENMIAQGSPIANDFFSNFKNFTKWLQIFGFAFGVLALAYKVISDLTEQRRDDI